MSLHAMLNRAEHNNEPYIWNLEVCFRFKVEEAKKKKQCVIILLL